MLTGLHWPRNRPAQLQSYAETPLKQSDPEKEKAMPRLKDLLAPACATLLLALFTTSAVQATPDDWVKAAFKHAEWPSYISVSNKPGSKLDIGQIKGDVTYEFFVKAKSADGKSSCLLGVQGKNSCNAGLKFCQFNSKRHGITEFGKTDHTFAEPAPEINTDLTHLTFVAEKEANRTTLYVNAVSYTHLTLPTTSRV